MKKYLISLRVEEIRSILFGSYKINPINILSSLINLLDLNLDF